jgi:AhpD family alkylhydroperoxidase
VEITLGRIRQAKSKSISLWIRARTSSFPGLSKQFHPNFDNSICSRRREQAEVQSFGAIPSLNIGGYSQQKQNMYNKESLAKLKKMNTLAPEVMKAFWAFDKIAVADGAIPVKYKELIAIAVALTTQCPYCIEIHSNNARKAGATEEEIAEAAMVAASLRAGAAVTHATHALLG